MDIREKADTLERYAGMEGTEIGETWAALSQLARYTNYLGEEFCTALETEIDDQLSVIAEQTVETVQEVTHTHTVTTLEWTNG